MIRRGTRFSRFAALSLALGPFVIAAAAFAAWAVLAWSDASKRIIDAEAALHVLDARRSQAEIYGPVSKRWLNYAASSASGMLQEPDTATAGVALVAQIEALFARAGGGRGVATLIGASPPADGLEKVRAEARGRLPEAALPAFFDGLEKQEPFLFVEALDVQRADDAGGEPVVELRLRISAYRMTGAGQ